jgi:hypothetical protein
MTPEAKRLHTRLGKLKGRLFNLIGKIESLQLLLLEHKQ